MRSKLCNAPKPIRKHQQSSQLGILKGAINIPIQELADRLDELENYKDPEIKCVKWLLANKSGEENEQKVSTEEGMSKAKSIGF